MRLTWTMCSSWHFLRGCGRGLVLMSFVMWWGYSPIDAVWVTSPILFVLALTDTAIDRLFDAGPNGETH